MALSGGSHSGEREPLQVAPNRPVFDPPSAPGTASRYGIPSHDDDRIRCPDAQRTPVNRKRDREV